MESLVATTRDQISYYLGYTRGRFLSDWTTYAFSKFTSLITLPLPLLSLLSLPFYFGPSTSFALFGFYLAWSAIVFSHHPLVIEIFGTLCVRSVFYLAPALFFLAFDCILPDVSANIKSHGRRALPTQLGRKRLTNVVAGSVINTIGSVVVQALLEVLVTEIFHMRSLLKVSSFVPLPLSMLQDVIRGFILRGIAHYLIHRFMLHTWDTPLKSLHERGQHSVKHPFSLVAAYDSLPCHLIGQWLPTFLPAVIFRFHVLTWLVFLALVNLEQLTIYSGYAVLPSSIILGGAARRTEAHFITLNRKASNFGHWGILDYTVGTNCKQSPDVMDDIQSEAEKHRVKERTNAAVLGAKKGIEEEENRVQQDISTSNGSIDAEEGADEELETKSGFRQRLRRKVRS